jgi:hypothetical protein
LRSQIATSKIPSRGECASSAEKHSADLRFHPLLYLVYSLIRGAITGIYLYPFVEVGKLGYARVALNAVMLLLAFLGTSLLLVAIGRWMPQGKSG